MQRNSNKMKEYEQSDNQNEMLAEPALSYAVPMPSDTIIVNSMTREELNEKCYSLEESKRLLTEMIQKHFHSENCFGAL